MVEIMQYQKKRDDNPAFREALRKIWLSGFDDAPGYFDFFYEKRVRTGQAEIFCALSGAQAVGAAYFLPAEIRRPGVPPQKAYYGYAFAILPEYRGTGIYQKLAHAFFRFADAEKAGILFCPENEKLLRYYTANGTVQNYIAQQAVFSEAAFARMTAAGALRELLPEESELYKEIRDTAFQENDFLCWDTDAVKYALEENRYCGGFCKIWNIAGKNYLLFGKKEKDGSVRISETTLPPCFLIRNGARLSEKPLVTYGILPAPRGRAGLLLD